MPPFDPNKTREENRAVREKYRADRSAVDPTYKVWIEKRKARVESFYSFFRALRARTPAFVFVFVGAMALRSVGDSLFASGLLGEGAMGTALATYWKDTVTTLSGPVSQFCLSLAMAGLGLSTLLPSLRAVGWAPLAVGFFTSLTVAALGLVTAFLLFDRRTRYVAQRDAKRQRSQEEEEVVKTLFGSAGSKAKHRLTGDWLSEW